VRTPSDLSLCTGLIIPGGESTSIALLAKLSGLLDPLREFVKREDKSVWGTCAGAILIADGGVYKGGKKGGQEGLGGVGVRVERNGWGSQVGSCLLLLG
jgi:5'-phosphate synthase pdxT subunit